MLEYQIWKIMDNYIYTQSRVAENLFNSAEKKIGPSSSFPAFTSSGSVLFPRKVC